MSKKVLVTIKGTQKGLDEEETSVSSVQSGVYCKMRGKHLVEYEEVLDMGDGKCSAPVSNLLKFTQEEVWLRKRGGTSADMYFKEGSVHKCMYDTGFGTLEMGMVTNSLEIFRHEEGIDVRVEYGLDMNGAHVSDNTIEISVKNLE